MRDEDFNWNDAEITIPEQLQIAVYTNPNGDVVIRQASYPDDDHWVVLAAAHAVKLCRRILLEAGSDHVVAHCDDVADGMAGGVNPEQHNRHGPKFRPGSDATPWDHVPPARSAPAAESPAPFLDMDSGRAERRARVKAALQADANRSNRDIARECGVSDKTVAAIRAELGAELGAEFRTDTPVTAELPL